MTLAKPFELELNPDEIEEIRGAAGAGGQQTLQRRIVDEADANGGLVTFNDAQIGQLIRYMTQYGSGGFQSRLNRAFKRPLSDLLGW